jgi:hypothetical protein
VAAPLPVSRNVGPGAASPRWCSGLRDLSAGGRRVARLDIQQLGDLRKRRASLSARIRMLCARSASVVSPPGRQSPSGEPRAVVAMLLPVAHASVYPEQLGLTHIADRPRPTVPP